MSVHLRPVEENDLDDLASMAKRIWHDYFPPMIGQEQVDYMVGKFQTADAIRHQIKEGYRYFWIEAHYETGDARMGYLAYRHEPATASLFVSKFYLEARARKKGVGWAAQRGLEEEAGQLAAGTIWLTVNRENHAAIETYKGWGYKIIKEQMVDIGDGYFMDDYVMEKRLSHPDDQD